MAPRNYRRRSNTISGRRNDNHRGRRKHPSPSPPGSGYREASPIPRKRRSSTFFERTLENKKVEDLQRSPVPEAISERSAPKTASSLLEEVAKRVLAQLASPVSQSQTNSKETTKEEETLLRLVRSLHRSFLLRSLGIGVLTNEVTLEKIHAVVPEVRTIRTLQQKSYRFALLEFFDEEEARQGEKVLRKKFTSMSIFICKECLIDYRMWKFDLLKIHVEGLIHDFGEEEVRKILPGFKCVSPVREKAKQPYQEKISFAVATFDSFQTARSAFIRGHSVVCLTLPLTVSFCATRSSVVEDSEPVLKRSRKDTHQQIFFRLLTEELLLKGEADNMPAEGANGQSEDEEEVEEGDSGLQTSPEMIGEPVSETEFSDDSAESGEIMDTEE